MLRFIPNHAAELISKVLISAAANALDGWGAGVEELKVQNILADGGPTLKRVRARAQGRAYRILKRTSHLTVILTDAPPPGGPAAPTAAPAKPKAVRPGRTEAGERRLANSDCDRTGRGRSRAGYAGRRPSKRHGRFPARSRAKARRAIPRTRRRAARPGRLSRISATAEPHEAKPVTASDAPEEDMSATARRTRTKAPTRSGKRENNVWDRRSIPSGSASA